MHRKSRVTKITRSGELQPQTCPLHASGGELTTSEAATLLMPQENASQLAFGNARVAWNPGLSHNQGQQWHQVACEGVNER